MTVEYNIDCNFNYKTIKIKIVKQNWRFSSVLNTLARLHDYVSNSSIHKSQNSMAYVCRTKTHRWLFDFRPKQP